MKDDLASLHVATYNSLADEYENRVETLRPVTEYALAPFVKLLPAHARVLDVGCAVGYTTEILNSAGMVAEGIDISPKMVWYAQARNRNSTIRQGDFLEASLESGAYDGILMYAFIHLFPAETAISCLERAATLLKPNGLLFVGTTKSAVSSEGFEVKSDYTDSQRRYRKRWTQEELENAMHKTGFKIIRHEDIQDEYKKVWMDYIVQRSV